MQKTQAVREAEERAAARGASGGLDEPATAPYWCPMMDGPAGTPPCRRARADATSAGDGELVQRNKELSALVALAETISRSQELRTVLEDALEKVLEIVAMEGGEILILDPDSGRLVLRATRGIETPQTREGVSFAPGEGVPGLVAEAARPMVIRNVLKDPRFVRARAGWQTPHALVGIPLMARGEVVGVMDLFCLRECPHRTEECVQCACVDAEDVSLLLAMGQQIGMAIDSARLWEELRRKEKNRAHLLQQVIVAQEEERKRIARELHDGAGQLLASLMISVKRLQSMDLPEEACARMREIRATAARILEEVHDLALGLRPSMLDDLGLAVALACACDDLGRRTGIAVDYHRDGLESIHLPGAVEIAVYRIVQEALTNVAKHASASNVSLLLRARGGRLRAIVEDDGVGFDVAATLEDAPEERKLGLVGMQERASLLGGSCTVESRPGAGCTVVVEVPIPRQGEAYE
ncbi:MAG: GAF domain-containing sensor histidine kinase [Armatimonadetes bacterium]|nr:GAF domain-containing sensor histidine kinase [Armatimonadota bacterium]